MKSVATIVLKQAPNVKYTPRGSAPSYQRLMSVDPSLTCSGWALFSIPTQSLLAVGKLRSLNSRYPMSERVDELQQKIDRLYDKLGLQSGDVLICEAQTTMRDPRAAFQVEQVRGIFETLARSREALVPGRLNPRSVQYEVMGLTGKQLARDHVKRAAIQTVMTVYGQDLTQLGFQLDEQSLRRHQDVVDAILIGALGLVRVAAAQQTETPLVTLLEQRDRRVRMRSRRA